MGQRLADLDLGGDIGGQHEDAVAAPVGGQRDADAAAGFGMGDFEHLLAAGQGLIDMRPDRRKGRHAKRLFRRLENR